MTRVLLINPPSPERAGVPLLGLQYVAAPLVARGCDVRVIDAAARHFDHDADWIVREAESFQPDIIGFSLFTRWVFHAYELVQRFRGLPALLVAGGPHATVRAEETLAHGFDVAVIGEAEETMIQVVDFVEGRRTLAEIAGVKYGDGDGRIRSGPPYRFIEDLDRIPFPQVAQHLFDPRWYSAEGDAFIPGGILTSRGCPARCTFCANYVTGRRFRYRSAANVTDELTRYHAMFGTTFFPFWDDAVTAHLPRLYELCAAFERLDFPLSWFAITRAPMVTPELLAAMKRGGCTHVTFGVESGDDRILRAIRKGITTDHVVRALEWAKDAGLTTSCTFMVGFPEDTVETLECSLRFMERIAPLVDTFGTLGVLVPFPGTAVYDEHHERFGFSEWWLREDYSGFVAPPPVSDFDRFYRYYIDDANLQLDFFHYADDVKAAMRACLQFKAEHNLRKMGLLEAR